MNALQELSQTVRQRRTDMALTQATLAQLSGLLPATTSQTENGTIAVLSLARAVRLLGVVGLMVHVSPARGEHNQRSALDFSAQTASVSFRQKLSVSPWRKALCSGAMPAEFLAPHVHLARRSPGGAAVAYGGRVVRVRRCDASQRLASPSPICTRAQEWPCALAMSALHLTRPGIWTQLLPPVDTSPSV